jgi:phosphoglycolate phosphatase
MTTILFDLDGTLIDSTGLVLPIYTEVIRRFANNPPLSDEEMRKTFGLPDDLIWQTLLPNATAEERIEAFELCERLVHERINTEDLLFPHTRDVLKSLYDQGYTLTTASNCGTGYLNLVLDTQGIRSYFTRPLCLESVGGRVKADILTEHFRHFDKCRAVMVGDRITDVEAADAHGIPTIGCAFGFGDRAELAGAHCIITSLTELPAVIQRLF